MKTEITHLPKPRRHHQSRCAVRRRIGLVNTNTTV